MPVATVFENLEAGSSIEEIIEQFHVTREQIQAVLEFAARSLDSLFYDFQTAPGLAVYVSYVCSCSVGSNGSGPRNRY